MVKLVGRTSAVLFASAAMSVLLLSGCGGSDAGPSTSLSAPADASAPSATYTDLAQYYSQVPQWRSYAEAFDAEGLSERIQTAQISVPIDYDNLQLGAIELALYRQVAAENAEGAIVLNPGGPGGGGENLVLDADFILDPAILDTRDIVSFDPRGVFRSNPIECRTDAELDASAQSRPDSEAAVEANRSLGEACLNSNPELLAHVDTSNVARDLDVIREVLGQPLLDYLGFSYGTELGQRYLQLFPQRSGRIVLDAAVPINISIEDVARGQAAGFEASYALFIDEYTNACQVGDNDCDLGSNATEVRTTIQNLVDAANARPIPAEDGRTITGAALTGMIANSLYGTDEWVEVSDALVAAKAGDGQPALELYDLYLGRDPDGTYADNSADAFAAISALDYPTTLTSEQVQALAEELREISPLFGADMAWQLWALSDWPVDADEQTPATPEGFSDIPAVLVIGGANDPATPLIWAEQTRDLLPGSVLVVWDGVGHTATGTGSTCVDDIVTAFLLEGVLPTSDTVCPA